MAALFLGGLLSVGFFATPQKKKLGLQLKNPDFVAVGGPRRVPPSSPDQARKPHGFCRPFSSVETFAGGRVSPENPWRKGELIHMNIGVKVMCLLICMHSKKRKIQSDNQKKQRDLNSKRDSRKWSNAKGFIPQKFSHDVIGTFMKASRHAWIIDVSNWCPQHFFNPQKNTSKFCLKGNLDHIWKQAVNKCTLYGMKPKCFFWFSPASQSHVQQEIRAPQLL